MEHVTEAVRARFWAKVDKSPGVNHIHKIRRGEKWKDQPIGPSLPNASIKFSSEDIRAICECATVKEAMACFGISQSYAYHLRRGKRLEV